MLSEHLRQLEKDQHVEYSLTEKGRSLMPLLEEIQNWGLQHLDGVVSIRQMLAESASWHAMA